MEDAVNTVPLHGLEFLEQDVRLAVVPHGCHPGIFLPVLLFPLNDFRFALGKRVLLDPVVNAGRHRYPGFLAEFDN